MPPALLGPEGREPFSWGSLRVQELEERVRAARQATIYALNQMLDLKDLNRKPGPLDPDEWRVMRMHPEFSWAVLRLVPGLERASLFALHHHEKFDGSGYPSGLRGDEIPIGARIVSVIDAFDAMVATRPYKEGLSCEEALRRLTLDSGSHFDPAVVQHFIGIARAEMPSVFAATGVAPSTEL